MKKLGYLILGFLLTLPIGALALQGVDLSSTNTGVTDDAWTTYAPSLSCGNATFTVNSARAKIRGKETKIQLDFTISAIGTCTRPVTFTLPNTAQSSGSLVGAVSVGTTITLTVCTLSASSATVSCDKNVGAGNPFLVNERFIASSVYENQ